jgi:hypothetical protein
MARTDANRALAASDAYPTNERQYPSSSQLGPSKLLRLYAMPISLLAPYANAAHTANQPNQIFNGATTDR